jgi:hypothetical protein
MNKTSIKELRFGDIQDRVKAGRSIEKQVLEVIEKIVVKSGYVVTPPTIRQDKHDKIDGVISRDGISHSIQIKFRQTGEDILVEVIRPFTYEKVKAKVFDGRDMIGKADWYAVLHHSGRKIYWINASVLKRFIEKAIDNFAKELENGIKLDHREDGIELKIVNDPRDGIMKLMAFVTPEKVSKAVLDADINLE